MQVMHSPSIERDGYDCFGAVRTSFQWSVDTDKVAQSVQQTLLTNTRKAALLRMLICSPSSATQPPGSKTAQQPCHHAAPRAMS